MGVLLSPKAWRQPWCKWWATDNDVFSHRNDIGWWEREGEESWIRMADKLDAIPADRPPLFILIPDVVGDWQRTLDYYDKYRHHVLDRQLPIAIALQNGAESDMETVLKLRPDFVFIGGDVEWKWRFTADFTRFFRPRGIRVHVGRASGPWRVRECIRVGVDSCDGTGWNRFADRMLPGLFQVLDNSNPQQRLGI